MSISESVWAQPQGEGKREDRFAGPDELFDEASALFRPEELMFLCIGTDRSSGDAFGPLVGSRLKAAGFPHVAGTLEEPCDATRLEAVVAALPPELKIVAFDACLGKPGSVGKFLSLRAPLTPAGSMKGTFVPIGDYSIAAVVNVYGPKPYQALQTASLGLVLQMADRAAASAVKAFGLEPVTAQNSLRPAKR
ncbi:spore protease YyaC [Saccharibacillus alkalitolerans]|uniref:Spore protease YyaC n=1 Tax=Saccharibacillus alkalitolerans TaxID=2705290 RepID=A0ABX0FCN0_9BACL|nr:spore protease YyaC [Saccharibacillus alkalitolerans]NGZ77884.1 spore protease YyaC [Saccharibacillus alkalitolerans]